MIKKNMTLGEKIKYIRKEKGITQAKLAGKEITRNMLSLIENDLASPSISTLKYLAKQLKIPVSYLISEEDDLFFYQKKEMITRIYDSFSKKNYRSVVFLIETLSGIDSELAYMLAVSHYELGREFLFKGSLVTAINHFKAAESAGDKTLFDLSRHKATIPMYVSIAENVQSSMLKFDRTKYHGALSECVDYELYKYLIKDFSYEFKNEQYCQHIKAKALIKERNYTEALKVLTALSDELKGDSYNAIVIIGVYSDMEFCYRMNNDYENAYLYSGKRISLLEGFKS